MKLWLIYLLVIFTCVSAAPGLVDTLQDVIQTLGNTAQDLFENVGDTLSDTLHALG